MIHGIYEDPLAFIRSQQTSLRLLPGPPTEKNAPLRLQSTDEELVERTSETNQRNGFELSFQGADDAESVDML